MKHLLVVLAVCLTPAFAFGQVADSAADFAEAQGPNWFNGFYDQTADSDGTYAAEDFQAFGDGNSFNWTGSTWDEANADGDNVPWTMIAADNGHPNGDNNGDVHLAVRRWVPSSAGTFEVDYSLSKQNANCGNGTTVLLYHNGSEIASSTIEGGDAVGVADALSLTMAAGDTLDLALSPLGTDGGLNDGCDGTFFGMTITQVPEPNGMSMLLMGALAPLFLRKRKQG